MHAANIGNDLPQTHQTLSMILWVPLCMSKAPAEQRQGRSKQERWRYLIALAGQDVGRVSSAGPAPGGQHTADEGIHATCQHAAHHAQVASPVRRCLQGGDKAPGLLAQDSVSAQGI